ncbi:MAG TPA: Hpt domain-containing protein [Lysobacter sp.]
MFEPLSRLFRGDPAKVRRALDVFQRTTCSDLEQLDRAYAAGDRASIGRLMHKMRSGCMQVGEDAAAEAIQAVERTLHAAAESDAFARAFAFARDELDRVQARVAAYLSTESETGEG